MQRLRAEHGAFTSAGIMVALLIVAFLSVGAMAKYGGFGAGGGGGGVSDATAQAEVQQAFTALQRCVQKNPAACTPKQLAESQPTLLPYVNHLSVNGTSVSITAKSKNVYTVSPATGGRMVRSCATAGQGQCPATGYW